MGRREGACGSSRTERCSKEWIRKEAEMTREVKAGTGLIVGAAATPSRGASGAWMTSCHKLNLVASQKAFRLELVQAC